MIGKILQSDRPISASLKAVRNLYLAGMIPTVLYKKFVASLLGNQKGIGGDVVLETRKGKILIDSDDEIGRDILFYLCYDRNVIGFLRQLFNDGKNATMLDIGGNIGNHAVWLADCFERVLSFEPNPDAFKYLSFNQKPHGNISAFPIGLSTESGTAMLQSDDENNLGKAGIADHAGNHAIEIPLEAGDNFLREHGIADVDFIKIDVEGHEWEVLNGLKETIRTHLPIIVLEYHQDTARKSGYKLQEFLSGYHMYGMVGLPKSTQMRSLQEGVVLSEFDVHQDYTNVLCIPQNRRRQIEARFPGTVWRNSRFFNSAEARTL
jgi:FkbM family methyltransferase